MAVQNLKSPPGFTLTTAAAQTLYTCPTVAPLYREIVQVTFNNIDGVNDAALPVCNWIDSSAANAATAILPVNARVVKLDSVMVTKTLDPGDSIVANASENGDIAAVIEVIGREAV